MTISLHALLKMVAMGGYASYVWSAYAIVAASFTMMPLIIKRQKRKLIAELRNNAST